jgi:uncharacterized protein DUF3786
MGITGEERAWDILAECNIKDVQTRADIHFDPSQSTYILPCFGNEIHVSLKDRRIYSRSDTGKYIADALKFLSRLAILRYLIHAEKTPESGQLIKPTDLPGGDFFQFGTHVLPMEAFASRFGDDLQAFTEKGAKFGGQRQSYGDAAIKLYPFPRFPIILIIWSGDDEFPAKASLLLDKNCCSHMPIDIIWSIAMMTLELMQSAKPFDSRYRP